MLHVKLTSIAMHCYIPLTFGAQRSYLDLDELGEGNPLMNNRINISNSFKTLPHTCTTKHTSFTVDLATTSRCEIFDGTHFC